MRKSILKSLLILFIFFIVMVFFISMLDLLNLKLSHHVNAFDNEVSASYMAHAFHTVENVQAGDGETTLTIKSERHQPVSLLIDNLKFPHKITINGKLVSQNLDPTIAQYDSSYTYQVFEIGESQYIEGKSIIQTIGSGASGIKLYLADSKQMKSATEIRTICYSIMLTCLFLIFSYCVVIYFHKQDARHYLLFAACAAVSIIKSINLGELFVLAEFFGLTAQKFEIINRITSNINIILPVLIMLNLMHIPVRKIWKSTMSLCFLLLMIFTIADSLIGFYLFTVWMIIMLNIGISIYGCLKKKPFCGVILLNNALFLSFSFYGVEMINRGLRGDALDFYIYLPYLGSILCLFIFLIVFIKSNILHTKELEAQKQEYERIALLRGIGHDLKLPLSVIKTSNQMLVKYDLKEEKRTEYAQMNLEAASELEKMTNNISSFLSLGQSDNKDSHASLRESFDKARRHYSIYSRSSGHFFDAVWEGEDALFPISSLQLERMLYNLLDNAFKYTETGGKISLSCRIDSEKAIIRVSDNGAGMDKSQLKQIFVPFYRAQDSRTKNGLGLGLSVVKGIVESLNGVVKSESEKGSGTTFTVILPI